MSNDNTKPTQEEIKHPSYYKMDISPIDFIMANRLDFSRGSMIKYICRAGNKGGKQGGIADMRKVIAYAELMIKTFEGED